MQSYITLENNQEEDTTTPLFLSNGVLESKRHLKLYAKQKYGRVLTYKYTLDDEFKNGDIVARFADEHEHSIDVIQISEIEPAQMATSWWGSSYSTSPPARQYSIVKRLYFQSVITFKGFMEQLKKEKATTAEEEEATATVAVEQAASFAIQNPALVSAIKDELLNLPRFASSSARLNDE